MNSSSSIYVSHKLIKDIKDGLPTIVKNSNTLETQFTSLTKLSESEFLHIINKNNEKLVEDVMEYMKIKLRYNENTGSYVKENYNKYKKNYYEKNKEKINEKNAERMRIRRLKIKENKLLEIEKI
jgi:hypothetical protein